MSAHTPGPWKVRRHERGQVEVVTGDGTSNVAIVHGLSLRPDGDPETDANATLIAGCVSFAIMVCACLHGLCGERVR